MQMKKTLMMAGVGTAVGLATFAGAASAQTPDAAGDMLADKIATRFNLNKEEVRSVLDEHKAARHAGMQQKMEERLTEAVEEGKITETQKQAIIDKHKEMKAYMVSLEGKTPEERKQLMQKKTDELRQWAQDNGLTEYVMFGRGGHHIKMVGPDEKVIEKTE